MSFEHAFSRQERDAVYRSINERRDMRHFLRVPEGGRPIAVLCLGHVEGFYGRPMLEMEGWTEGLSLAQFVSENHYPNEEQQS